MSSKARALSVANSVIVLLILLGKATKQRVPGKETAREGLVKCIFIHSGQEGCVRVEGHCAQDTPEENP